MRIDTYSHNFSITEMTPKEKEVVQEFLQPLIQYEIMKERGGRSKRVPVRLYGAAFKDRTMFRFHINQLEDFKQTYLRYFKSWDFVNVVEHSFDYSNFPIIDHSFKKPITPFEEQKEFIDGILGDGYAKMLAARTGFGKTIIALYCASQLNARTLFTFKGGFSDRWKDEFEKTFNLDRDDLFLLQGSSALIAAQEMAMAGELEAKLLILTTRTYQMYIDHFEKNSGESDLYPIPPWEMHEQLGIGFHVKDEFHMEHHLNHKIELYTHCPKTLALSATMHPSDPFLEGMYQVAYPLSMRMVTKRFEPYISVSAIFYRFKKPGVVKCRGQKGYSHVAFEQSIMSKTSTILPNYMNMIARIVLSRFIRRKNPGEKCLIFCATVEFCTLLVEVLQKQYPDLKINRYTQEDPYENLLDADIGVSTVLSAGTAVDIPGLRFTLMTTAINSRQSNEQALGRLREMWKWRKEYKTDPVLKEINPEFAYLACADIDRHNQYHYAKEDYFKGKVVRHQSIPYSDGI